MSILKEIHNDVKYNNHELGGCIKDLFGSIYYGIIKNDDYSRGEIKIHLMGIRNCLTYPFRTIKNGIKNIWNWRTIIWSDRQFDYVYLLKIIEFKLDQMEKFFNSNDAHCLEAKNVAIEIKECREIISQLASNSYEDQYWEEYNKKYPHTDIVFTPTESEKDRVEKGLPPRYYTMNRNNDDEERCVMVKKINENIENKKKELYEQLFSKLSNNIEKWWD